MDKISLIIVGKSDTVEATEMLRTAITTATLFNKTPVEVIVVDDYFKGAGVKIIEQPKPFKYNECLNAGAKEATGNYFYFANSDLLFKPNALDELIRQMVKHKAGSSSAICPKYHKNIAVKMGAIAGYKVGIQFTGWGFMMSREAYNKIGGLRASMQFYCSDNETVEQLKEHGIKHILVKTAEIEHLGSQTQKHLDSETYFSYTVDDVRHFNKLYGQNIFNLN